MTSARRSRALLLVLALALSACARGADEVASTPGTAAAVAVRASDLPEGIKRCEYSGPIESYIEKVRPISAQTHASISRTWAELQRGGATEGYYSVYADTLRACRYFLTGAPEGHTPGGVRLVATIVARFADPAVATRVYEADVFGQSALARSGAAKVRTGDDTGLGPNSVAAVDEDADPKTGQALWQAGAFNVFLRGQNLTRAQFDELATTLSQRAQ